MELDSHTLELVVYPALPLTSLCVVRNIYLSFLLFVVIHTVKGFSIVNEVEVDVFLEFSCFFYDLTDVHSLISYFSAFSKSSLYICKFSVHIVLSLIWRILSITFPILVYVLPKWALSITLIACEMNAIVQ